MIGRSTAIIKKNIKLIMRSKSSALIVIFGPLLLILLIGAAFNTANIYGIRVGTYSESYSTLTNAVINELHKKRFSTVAIDSEATCVESIKRGIVHVCAIFPPDLSIKTGGDIVFYVDNSRLNLVYIVLDTLSTIIGSKSKELSAQLTKTIIDALDNADREVKDKLPLLAALESDSKASEQRLTTISQDLGSLDITITPSNIARLEAEAKRVSTENDSLIGLVATVKREIEETEEKLENAEAARQKAVKEMSLVGQVLADNMGYINTLEASAARITGDIRNVKTTSISKIVSPLTTRIEPIAKDKTHLSYVFPTLIVLIIMFVSMLLAATLEVKEKTAKVYFKNFITPASDSIFIVSNFITNLLIVILQLVVVFGVAFYFFKDQLLAVLQNIILLPLVIAAVFILLGMCIGNIFRSEETATLAAISLGFIFLFFSSAILPIETLPEIIGKIAAYNPFFIGESMVNKVLLFQSPLQPLLPSLYILLGYVGGLVILTVVTKKAAKRRI